MGFFDELKDKASELLGGPEIASKLEEVTSSVQDVAGGDLQAQITQYAEEHGLSFEVAKEKLLGGKEN